MAANGWSIPISFYWKESKEVYKEFSSDSDRSDDESDDDGFFTIKRSDWKGFCKGPIEYQKIIDAKWSLIRYNRMERLLRGKSLKQETDNEWLTFSWNILWPIFGQLDSKPSVVEEFLEQRNKDISIMFGFENEMLGLFRENNHFPPSEQSIIIADKLKGHSDNLEQALNKVMKDLTEWGEKNPVKVRM